MLFLGVLKTGSNQSVMSAMVVLATWISPVQLKLTPIYALVMGN